MGIKGAWSLLSNDPRRFGQPWVSQNKADDDGEHWVYFLDGPSLLYHIAVKDVYDQYPPVSQVITKSSSRPCQHQACPRTIYLRVTNFLSALLEAAPINTQIHVVMDGLAPAAKIPTQVQRMTEQCRDSRNVLHLLAESAMVEAIEDMRKDTTSVIDRLRLHRPSHGEAETYIYHWLMRSQDTSVAPSPRISILSNDTDFLIYSTCPGFVPFSTLTITREDSSSEGSSKLHVSGFEYLRSKFINAYFAGVSSNVNMEEVMTCVAALAGCDYVCEHGTVLDEARTNMMQSDIGGLRVKQRNNPSRASVLVAIARYIGHYARRSQQPGDWKERMSTRLCGNSSKSELLLAAFRDIHPIYFPLGGIETFVELKSHESVELLRLAEHCTLFCRPLVEPSTTSESSAPTHSSRKHVRRKNGGKRRRTSASSDSFVTRVGPRTETVPESPIAVPPKASQVSEWKSKGSAWLMPHLRQIRLRLYSFISKQTILLSGDGECGLSQLSSHQPMVTEFVRLGRKEFGRLEVHVPPLSSSLWDTGCWGGSLSCFQSALACITGSSTRTMDVLPDELKEHATLFLSSLMLPRPAALFLLLVGTAPTRYNVDLDPNKNTESLGPSLKEMLCMASVAWVHASLVCEAVASDGDPLLSCRSRASNVFDIALAQIIWKVLSDSCSDDDWQDLSLEAVFERLPAVLSLDCSIALEQKDVAEWKRSTSMLWDGWRKSESLARG